MSAEYSGYLTERGVYAGAVFERKVEVVHERLEVMMTVYYAWHSHKGSTLTGHPDYTIARQNDKGNFVLWKAGGQCAETDEYYQQFGEKIAEHATLAESLANFIEVVLNPQLTRDWKKIATYAVVYGDIKCALMDLEDL